MIGFNAAAKKSYDKKMHESRSALLSASASRRGWHTHISSFSGDNETELKDSLLEFVSNPDVNVVITSSDGTLVSVADITPESMGNFINGNKTSRGAQFRIVFSFQNYKFTILGTRPIDTKLKILVDKFSEL